MYINTFSETFQILFYKQTQLFSLEYSLWVPGTQLDDAL